jgi:hypothetical protein
MERTDKMFSMVHDPLPTADLPALPAGAHWHDRQLVVTDQDLALKIAAVLVKVSQNKT